MPTLNAATPGTTPGTTLRHAGRDALAAALVSSRQDTLATFAAVTAQMAGQGLQVPCLPVLNLPLWELGHIGWFQEWWIARNPQRQRGTAADPDAARAGGVRGGADALYDSSRVPHASRWHLPLPDADGTRSDLACQLARTLDLLADSRETDEALYFFRLALLHEDMHHEAALYMAQTLGVSLPDDARWQPASDARPRQQLALTPAGFTLGHDGPGFVFDNERCAHSVGLPGFAIDHRVIGWGEFLPFIDAGGYADARLWSAPGWAWCQTTPAPRSAPRDLRCVGGTWEQRHGAAWRRIDPHAPASHLSFFEAQAWCRWAGRRLPTEAEWERAALECGDGFSWGQVWEWTASAFAPYPGFVAHPYRDYSAPWFDGRPVLRGASSATQPRLRHPRYRNYFTPERNDVPAGFRSCRA